MAAQSLKNKSHEKLDAPNTTDYKTLFACFLTVFLWASAFVGIRAGLHGFSPGGLALFRYLIASFCMLFFYLKVPHKTMPRLRDIPQLLIIGVGGIGIYNVALNYGEITVNSGIAGFIIGLMPIFTMILSVLFLGERVSRKMMFGVFISIIGVTLIAIGEGELTHVDFGVIAILIAALVGSGYTVTQKSLTKRFHPIELASFAIWIGTVSTLFYLPQLKHEILKASTSAFIAVIYLGIFPAAIAYASWNFVLDKMPASKASSYLYYMPFIATFLGWIILGEVPHVIALIGGFIALAGAYIASRRRA